MKNIGLRWIIPPCLVLAITLGMPGHKPYERAVGSTVMLESGDGHGSGVFIGDGLVLTAAHVVVGQSGIFAHSPLWEEGSVVGTPSRYEKGMACSVIAANPAIDLALLRVDGQAACLAAGDEPKPGDELFIIGCANAPFGFITGHVRQVYHTDYPLPGGQFSGRVLDVSIPVNLGDSGAAAIDRRGRLVGIVVGMDVFKQQTNFVLSIKEIKSFLKGVGK